MASGVRLHIEVVGPDSEDTGVLLDSDADGTLAHLVEVR